MDKLTVEQNKLIEDNMGLAYNMAQKYFNQQENKYSYDDRVGDCLLALTRASKTYDKNKGVKFSTYASKSMFLAMMKSVNRLKYNKQRNLNMDITICSLTQDSTSNTLTETTKVMDIEDTSNPTADDIINSIDTINTIESFEKKLQGINKVLFQYMKNGIGCYEMLQKLSYNDHVALSGRPLPGKGNIVNIDFDDVRMRLYAIRKAFKKYMETGVYDLPKPRKRYLDYKGELVKF